MRFRYFTCCYSSFVFLWGTNFTVMRYFFIFVKVPPIAFDFVLQKNFEFWILNCSSKGFLSVILLPSSTSMKGCGWGTAHSWEQATATGERNVQQMKFFIKLSMFLMSICSIYINIIFHRIGRFAYKFGESHNRMIYILIDDLSTLYR